MIGILIILLISWVLLYLVEKKSIMALGILPPGKGLKQFIFGFFITGILCMGIEILETFLKDARLHINEDASFQLIGSMFFWDLKSVITEELIFRGALLYILIKRIGARKGILLSAIAFGIYHWFSFGILGAIIPMVVVFTGTGLMGYAWALAFDKTGSVFMPIGLHLGWNFVFNTIFSNGPLGNGLLVEQGGNPINDWYSLVGLWVAPLIVFLVVKFWVPKRELALTKRKVPSTINNL